MPAPVLCKANAIVGFNEDGQNGLQGFYLSGEAAASKQEDVVPRRCTRSGGLSNAASIHSQKSMPAVQNNLTTGAASRILKNRIGG
jgi:hypothetical protein